MNKYFGIKSLSSKLYIILSFIFIMSIIGSVLGVTALIVSRFINIDPIEFNWIFSFHNLTITAPSNSRFPVFGIITAFFASVLQFFILYYIKEIFRNFRDNLVFVEKNFIYLKRTGLLILISGIVMSLMNMQNWFLLKQILDIKTQSISYGLNLTEPWKIISNTIELNDFNMNLSFISEPGLLLIGSAILLFSHLFAMALKMKEENELTI